MLFAKQGVVFLHPNLWTRGVTDLLKREGRPRSLFVRLRRSYLIQYASNMKNKGAYSYLVVESVYFFIVECTNLFSGTLFKVFRDARWFYFGAVNAKRNEDN